MQKNKIEKIVQILYKYEESLSDGYHFYCTYDNQYDTREEEREHLDNYLREIAKEILEITEEREAR